MLARRFYLDGVDQVFARITYGGGGSIGILGYYLTDRQGSVVRIMDSSGGIVNTITYADAYGSGPTNSSSSQADRYEYAGGQYDKDTQLEYNGARFYDPSTEKWLSQDPIGFDGGDSNLYRYVGDSPTNGTDPSGEFVPALAVFIAAGIGVLVGADYVQAPGPTEPAFPSEPFRSTVHGLLVGVSNVMHPFSAPVQAAVVAGTGSDCFLQRAGQVQDYVNGANIRSTSLLQSLDTGLTAAIPGRLFCP